MTTAPAGPGSPTKRVSHCSTRSSSAATNANLCFNWFNASDTQRDAGEALSARQMVAAMVAEHGIDPARIFVTGLSAGGAMASVMLATYPDVFAGGDHRRSSLWHGRVYPGGVRPHAGAWSTSVAALGALVTAASPLKGPWQTISVWHGDSDATVSHANSALIVEQWRAIHGAAREPSTVGHADGHCRQVWRDPPWAGRDRGISYFRPRHGTPLGTSGATAYGAAGPYMLEAGISSTRRIAAFWGLIHAQAEDGLRPARTAKPQPIPPLPKPIVTLPGERGESQPRLPPAWDA